jgi:hypothetical protein
MASLFQRLLANLSGPQGVTTTHFWGPIANWGIVVAAVYDATNKGPEMISLPMTATLASYSALFMRFAWVVRPGPNYLLLACHTFNVAAQSYQLKRGLTYKAEQGDLEMKKTGLVPKSFFDEYATPQNIGGVVFAGAVVLSSSRIKGVVETATFIPKMVQSALLHPAGPFSSLFWAPTWKWFLSASNIADLDKPVERISTQQQAALCATGFIWSRYATVTTPPNWNLFAVNFVLAATGSYHLWRKFKAYSEEGSQPVQEEVTLVAASPKETKTSKQ